MMGSMRSFISRLIAGIVMLGMLAGAPPARADVVNVYTSANFAPLMLGDGRGVYPDLVAYLNRQKLGSTTFQLHFLPRKRLQVRLENNTLDGIVIGMMPEWFDDTAQKKYLWTQPFASDRFTMVAPINSKFDPDRPATLAGASIGTTLGYVYPGLDDWFDRTGVIRNDGISDEKNIEKLLLGRVDCVLVAESMARYFIKANKLGQRLHLLPMPVRPNERRFLVPHSQAAAFAKIAPVVRKLQDDPAWKKIMSAYE